MTARKELITSITQDIFDEFCNHCPKEDAGHTKIKVHEEDRTLEWVYEPYMPEDTLLSRAEALLKIKSWVINKLDKEEIIYLYTCTDNQLISIDDVDEDDDLEVFHEAIPNIFYIGYY